MKTNFVRLKPGTKLFDSVREKEVEFELWRKKGFPPFTGPTIQIKVDGQSLVHDASYWRFSRTK